MRRVDAWVKEQVSATRSVNVLVGRERFSGSQRRADAMKPRTLSSAEINEKRGRIRLSVGLEAGRLNGGVPEVVAYLQEALLRVPEESRGDAAVSVSTEIGYESDSWVEATIDYNRMETDDEVIERVLAAEQKAELAKAQEREQYFALKRKFEP